MHAVCRWLLISLLIMALPLKGLAAAGYMACTPLHTQSAPGHAHVAGEHDHAGHEAHGANLHGQHAAASTDETGSSADPLSAGGAIKCTQCAPCCGAVAPPVDPAPMLCAAGATEPKAALRLLELGGDSERLERPPRSRSA